MITGAASADGTAAYAAAHPALTYQPLGQTGWQVSQAGFGGYRVHYEVESHWHALQRALGSGINLVDTSSNYADGGSEALVGDVIGQMVASGSLSREQLVIVSKGGYLQGQNYELSQARKAEGRPFPDLVEYAQGLEHCLHPEFLAGQLTRSLQRLAMQTIDVYLLHNPEYFLGWAHKAGIPLAEARAEYERRLELAFRHLEEEVAAGRIQAYGISSNTFPSPAEDPEFTSLARVWEIATSIHPEHHFRVIQLPLNLLETGGITAKNQPDGRSVVALAREKALGILINRPLNAIQANRLVRLADVPASPPDPPATGELSTAVDSLVQAEHHFQSEILPSLALDTAVKQQVADFLSAGRMLHWRWRAFGSYHNWRDVRAQYLEPRLQEAAQFLRKLPNLPAAASTWLDSYARACQDVLAGIEAIYAAAATEEATAIKQRVAQADPAWVEATSLSQMALRALRTTAGVTTTLVGMRREEYVADVLAELERPGTTANREAAWERLQREAGDVKREA